MPNATEVPWITKSTFDRNGFQREIGLPHELGSKFETQQLLILAWGNPCCRFEGA
jgi:hypothetical protein